MASAFIGYYAASYGPYLSSTPPVTKRYLWVQIGNSFDTPGGSDTADPIYLISAYQQMGSPTNVTQANYGRPGHSLQWIRDNTLPTVLTDMQAAIASGNYDQIVVTVHGDENGLAGLDGYSSEVDACRSALTTICQQVKLQATSAVPVHTVEVPCVNRQTGGAIPADFNARRLSYNSLPTPADARVNPANQPKIWGNGYPRATRYCSDGVHETTYGANIAGTETAETHRPFFGIAALTPAYRANIDMPTNYDSAVWANTGAGTAAAGEPDAGQPYAPVSTGPDGKMLLTGRFLTRGNFEVGGAATRGFAWVGQFAFELTETPLGSQVFGLSLVPASHPGGVADQAIIFDAVYAFGQTIRVRHSGGGFSTITETGAAGDILLFDLYEDPANPGMRLLAIYYNDVQQGPATPIGAGIVVPTFATNAASGFLGHFLAGETSASPFATV